MIILMAAALALTPVQYATWQDEMDAEDDARFASEMDARWDARMHRQSPNQAPSYSRAPAPRPMYAGERDGGNVKVCYYNQLGVVSQMNVPIVSACPR